MSSRTKVIASAVTLFVISGWFSTAEEAPVPVTGDIAERIFKNMTSITVDDPSDAAICPVCGKPLWMHTEPDFTCLPKDRKVRQVKMQDAVCPVCRLTFKGPVPSGMSKDVEVDTDFCRHHIGKVNVAGRVWLCPRCGYAAWFEQFNKPVGADVKKFVREKLATLTLVSLKELLNIPGLVIDDLSFLQQLDIPDAIKYRNAVLIADESSVGSIKMARLVLEASHACRRAVNERLSAIFISRALLLADSLMVSRSGELLPLKERVGRIEQALASGAIGKHKVDVSAAFCLYVTLAGLYDRLGDIAQARACLEASATAGRFVEVQAEVQRKVLHDIITRRRKFFEEEGKYRRLALSLYRKMIVEHSVKGVDVLGAGYLVAELYRRDGKDGAAKAWFMALLPLSERVDPYLRERMLDLLEIPTVMRAPEDAGEAAVARKAVKDTGFLKAGALTASEPAVARRAVPSDEPQRSQSVESVAPVAPAIRPENCRQAMEAFYRAVASYRKSHDNEWPPDKETLVRGGLLSNKTVNDWACPESGVGYIYRRPPGDAKTFIFFHKNPMNCPCRLILYSDGSIEELAR